MAYMRSMKKRMIVFKAELLETGDWWYASSRDLPRVFLHGATLEELMERAGPVVEMFLKAEKRDVGPIQTRLEYGPDDQPRVVLDAVFEPALAA